MWDNDTFGAEAYVISSASSKTSIALAYAVKQRGEKQTIGFTSAANLAFVEALGCYDQVLSYDFGMGRFDNATVAHGRYTPPTRLGGEKAPIAQHITRGSIGNIIRS